MEIYWKWLNTCFGLLFFQLCNGFPINLEDSVADQHTQLLTGLVAVLLTVCSVVLVAGCLCCQRRNGFKEFRDSPVVASTASNLDHGHINPIANGEFTIFTPLSSSPYNNNVFLANERIITRTAEDFIYEDFDVSSWFNESEKDFPRIKLKYIKELGRGWFGKVVEGAAKEVPPNEEAWTPVVVRILEATASRKERVLFLNDAAIYRCGSHINILSLIGRCLDTVPLLLLQEYCPQGDLKHYLRSKKENAEQLLSTDHPLLWCCQLTSALKHLHDNGITHPDLATRNCQLTSDLTLKVGDYGLAESKYPEDYYQGSPRVPVRWCAPESLTCTLTTIQPQKVTTESNVWSLGVTMWEICEIGGQPYPNLSDDEVVSQVLGPSNVRLSRPSFPVLYTDYLYRLMQLCWTNAESRPTVTQIDLMLSDLWQVYKNTKSSGFSADDFDKRWESFKPNSGKNDMAEMEEPGTNIAKPLSPSLNNLHGSLDNLLEPGDQMELWLENVTKMEDLSLAKSTSNVGLSLDDPLVSEISSSESSDRASPKQKKSKLKSKIDFDLNVKFRDSNFRHPYNFSDSALFSQRTSSESETEDENWRKKVERGAYTEKVRLKSRSVADLMILTHVDYSESESETPLPSLDCRTNYRNVRCAPRSNLESAGLLTYGSEGNLLSVHDAFQEELKKLKEERRDSLLFVPDNRSHSFSKLDSTNRNFPAEEPTPGGADAIESTNKRLMRELNRVAEIQPANQVFNVFSVTIDKFKPIRVNSCKLNDIINFSDIEPRLTPERRDKPKEPRRGEEESHPLGDGRAVDLCDSDGKHISDYGTETYPPVLEGDGPGSRADDEELGVPQANVRRGSCDGDGSASDDGFGSEGVPPAGTGSDGLDLDGCEGREVVNTVNPLLHPNISGLEVGVQSRNDLVDEEPNNQNIPDLRDVTPSENSEDADDFCLKEEVGVEKELEEPKPSETTEKVDENEGNGTDKHQALFNGLPNEDKAEVISSSGNSFEVGATLKLNGLDVNLIPKLAEIVEEKIFTPKKNSIEGLIKSCDASPLINAQFEEPPKTTEAETFADANLLSLEEKAEYEPQEKPEDKNSNEGIHVSEVDGDFDEANDEKTICEAKNTILIPEVSETPNDGLLESRFTVIAEFITNEIEASEVFAAPVKSKELTVGSTEESTEDKPVPVDVNNPCESESELRIAPVTEVPKLKDIIKSHLENRRDEITSEEEHYQVESSLIPNVESQTCNEVPEFEGRLPDSLEEFESNEAVNITSETAQVGNDEIPVCDDIKYEDRIPKLSDIIKNKIAVWGKLFDEEETCQLEIVVESNAESQVNPECGIPESQEDLRTIASLDLVENPNCEQREGPQTADTNVIQTTDANVDEFREENDAFVPSQNIDLSDNRSIHEVSRNENIFDSKLTSVDVKEVLEEKRPEINRTDNSQEAANESEEHIVPNLNPIDFSNGEHRDIIENEDLLDLNGIAPLDENEICEKKKEREMPKDAENDKLIDTNVDDKSNYGPNDHILQEGVLDLNEIVLVDANEMPKDGQLQTPPKANEVFETCQSKDVIDLNEVILVDANETLKDDNFECLNRVPSGLHNACGPPHEALQDEGVVDLDHVNLIVTNESAKNNFEVPKLSQIILNKRQLETREAPYEACKKYILECEMSNEKEDVESTDDNPTEKITPVRLNLSDNQEQEIHLSPSHISVFTSTPAVHRSNNRTLSNNTSNVNLFGAREEDDEAENVDLFTGLVPLDTSKELNYSLETWDNFLGRTLDAQNDIRNDNLFDSFTSEPHSLLFVENGNDLVPSHESLNVRIAQGNEAAASNEDNVIKSNANNGTFVIEAKNDNTFAVEDGDCSNKTFVLNKTESTESETEDPADNSAWGNGGGWFLHPQTNNKEPSGTIEVRENTGSYVGFGIDDEIMAAIRNELLNKLPHAQVAPSEKVTEAEEWDSGEKNEVFLKYNIYNPPLSPILEESYIEESDIITPKQESDNEESEWSEPEMPEMLAPGQESQSAHTYDSQLKGPHHRHTPSQDSCCSNDTLFNLEELTCAAGDVDKENDPSKHDTRESAILVDLEGNGDDEIDGKCTNQDNISNARNVPDGVDGIDIESEAMNCGSADLKSSVIIENEEEVGEEDDEINRNEYIGDSQLENMTEQEGTNYISEFISQEIEHSSKQSSSEPNSSQEDCPIAFKKTQIAPLPSPEDNPWKQLPASLLSYDKVISQNNTLLLPPTEVSNTVPDLEDLPRDKDVMESQYKEDANESDEDRATTGEESNDPHYENRDAEDHLYENVKDQQPDYENVKAKEPVYENVKEDPPVYENVKETQPLYQNFSEPSDIYNEVDYVNIVNLENSKNNGEFRSNDKKDYGCVDANPDDGKVEAGHDEDIYGMLTDIRFNGPSENQLISTSFSESNDMNDEQDWDSGSDTRSSSSGEFIWKEGEHEESLKALRAAPQDVLENVKPMEGIEEESTDESDMSSTTSDEEGEAPEFVPSAWDKFATPMKSALRSPEKTLEKSEKSKSKGVSFKKQKYHCVYEYPREPESPVLQSQDLWKPQLDYNSFTDWEFDGDGYFPATADDNDIFPTAYNYRPISLSSRNLYQLTNISDFVPSGAGLEDEFFVSGSARPFDAAACNLSSQFFPGSASWTGENATPDSGVEDGTPGSSTEIGESSEKTGPAPVHSLRRLASDAVKRSKQMNIRNDSLGGLRHTRNKLKLDLPPSPSAFTSTKMFSVEPAPEPVIREKPTFTTFGKSRFSVQHVDTPPEDSKNRNVSFEALPHKPMRDSRRGSCEDIYDEDGRFVQEKHILRDKFDCGKGHSEFIRGEASLLDSADEDSGIESSTLERKLSSEGLLQ